MWRRTTPTLVTTAPIPITFPALVRTIRHCTRRLAADRGDQMASFAHGATSTFPNQSFNDTNYWVDVVLQPGPAPTLTSIAVTPANPSISTGTTQQFTATGTYSDQSTQNITTDR